MGGSTASRAQAEPFAECGDMCRRISVYLKISFLTCCREPLLQGILSQTDFGGQGAGTPFPLLKAQLTAGMLFLIITLWGLRISYTSAVFTQFPPLPALMFPCSSPLHLESMTSTSLLLLHLCAHMYFCAYVCSMNPAGAGCIMSGKVTLGSKQRIKLGVGTSRTSVFTTSLVLRAMTKHLTRSN